MARQTSSVAAPSLTGFAAPWTLGPANMFEPPTGRTNEFYTLVLGALEVQHAFETVEQAIQALRGMSHTLVFDDYTIGGDKAYGSWFAVVGVCKLGPAKVHYHPQYHSIYHED